MKKLLGTAALLLSLLGSGSANAMAVVDGTANILQGINNSVQTAWKAMDKAWQEAKDDFDKSAWGQQAKDMMDSLKKLQTQINEVMGLRDDLMSTMSGARDISGLTVNNGSSGTDNVDYRYAKELPQFYLSPITCTDQCDMSGTGYAGKAAPDTSKTIRDKWRVNAHGGNLTRAGIDVISNEAAEQNAQEIAIIQAMAQEAYMQANNRIKNIEALEAKIAGVTSGVNTKAKHGDSEGGSAPATVASPAQNNDLKYIADLQAQIQVQNALLINEQNKLAALAILQQSQRDAYEQQKREIAAYVVNGRSGGLVDGGVFVDRGLIAAAQTAAYASVVAAYQ